MSIRRALVLLGGIALVALEGCLWPTPAAAQAERPGRKLAFLVGVKKYDHGSLRDLEFPENDVTALADVLKAQQFEVVVLTTGLAQKNPALAPTSQNIRAQLNALLERRPVGKRDVILVGLAGHGIQPLGSGEAYFCPRDANPTLVGPNPQKPETLLGVGALLKQLDDSGIGQKLLLVDACRNDPGVRGRRGVERVEVSALPPQTGVLLSCAPGEFSFEHRSLDNGHGVFFYHVIRGLKGAARDSDTSEISWDGLRTYVKGKVPGTVKRLYGTEGGEQRPNEIGNLIGEPTVLAVAHAQLPAGPPGKPLRWLCSTVVEPRVYPLVPRVGNSANVVIDRSWQEWGDAVARSARARGTTVIAAFTRGEYPAIERRLFQFIQQNRDVVAGAAFLAPHGMNGGKSPQDVANFGRNLKRSFPDISYWVGYVQLASPKADSLPTIPAEVDVVVVSLVYAGNPEAVETQVDRHIPNWVARAGSRPVVLEWSSRPSEQWTPRDGPFKIPPGTLQKCADMAAKYKLAGVGFNHFGNRPDHFAPGIDTDPAAWAEIHRFATSYGFLLAPAANK